MMKLLILTLLVTANAIAADTKSFGTPITLKKETSIGDAIQNAATLNKKDILVSGEVKQVCQKKGCWMELTDGKSGMRVTFKNYAFFAPKDSAGRRVKAQGQVTVNTESVEQQKHYLHDAGASEKEINAVKEPKVNTTFVASGFEFAP